MKITLSHRVKTADIAIIDRETGQGIWYIIPGDLVLFLLWFLSSATAQFLAVVGTAAFLWAKQLTPALQAELRAGWAWLTDWPAWWAGVEIWIEDIRNLWGVGLCLSVN